MKRRKYDDSSLNSRIKDRAKNLLDCPHMPELTERQRNWAPWLGLLFALAAMLSNAGFFLRSPASGPFRG